MTKIIIFLLIAAAVGLLFPFMFIVIAWSTYLLANVTTPRGGWNTPLGDSNAIPCPEWEMLTLISWSPTLFHRGEIGDRGIVICLPGCGRCRKTQHGWGIGLVYGRGVSLVLPQQFQFVGVATLRLRQEG